MNKKMKLLIISATVSLICNKSIAMSGEDKLQYFGAIRGVSRLYQTSDSSNGTDLLREYFCGDTLFEARAWIKMCSCKYDSISKSCVSDVFTSYFSIVNDSVVVKNPRSIFFMLDPMERDTAKLEANGLFHGNWYTSESPSTFGPRQQITLYVVIINTYTYKTYLKGIGETSEYTQTLNGAIAHTKTLLNYEIVPLAHIFKKDLKHSLGSDRRNFNVAGRRGENWLPLSLINASGQSN
jgi:hypothetical protein